MFYIILILIAIGMFFLKNYLYRRKRKIDAEIYAEAIAKKLKEQ